MIRLLNSTGIHRFLIALSIIAAGLVIQGQQAHAASPAGSITASPAELLIEVAQRQMQQSKEITLTNNYDVPVTISAELRSIDENSGRFIPDAPLSEDVARALSISETDFQIQPRSSKTIIISGTNIKELGPGGHYATLLLTQRLSENQQLSLRSAISINVFFVKADGAQQSIRLDKSKAQSWLFHIASSAEVTFTNNGNVRSTPHGVVYVTNRHGDIISKGIANVGSQPLLPTKSLTNNLNLTRIQRVWYPQKLYFNISYHADDLDPQTKTYSFFYIPPFFLLLPLFLIGALYYLYVKLLKMKLKAAKKSSKKATISMPKILKIAIRLNNEEPTHIPVKKKPKN